LPTDDSASLIGGSNTQQESSNVNNANLTDELSHLETQLDALRDVANTIQSDLVNKRERILAMHNLLCDEEDVLELPDDEEPEQEQKHWWLDVNHTLTNDTRKKFDAHCKDLESMAHSRYQAITKLMEDCNVLIRELNLFYAHDDNGNEDETERNRLKELQDEDCQDLDMEFIHDIAQTSIPSNITTTITFYAQIWKHGIHSSTLTRLTHILQSLVQIKRRRKSTLSKLGSDIAALWERLDVSTEQQSQFSASVRGLGVDTIYKGECELKKLLREKQDRIGVFVEEVRVKIRDLECRMSVHGSNNDEDPQIEQHEEANEALLQNLEHQLHLLQQRYETMLPILQLIEKRECIIQERWDYEAQQRDHPDRLLSRNQRGLMKQLLEEEKLQRRIKKDLPKYTELLRRKLIQWQQQPAAANDDQEEGAVTRGPFLYKSRVYLEVIKTQEQEWMNYKEQEIQLRLQRKNLSSNQVLNNNNKENYYEHRSNSRAKSRGKRSGGNKKVSSSSMASATSSCASSIGSNGSTTSSSYGSRPRSALSDRNPRSHRTKPVDVGIGVKSRNPSRQRGRI